MLRYDMKTPRYEEANKEIPLPEYPRPQLKRESFWNLNGHWDYWINREGSPKGNPMGKILVPFPLESELSGVGRSLKEGEILVYQKSFALPKEFLKETTLLHIDAVDQICAVYCNGQFAGEQKGSYLPLVLDLSAFLKPGENTLTIQVKDALSFLYPTGKQHPKRGGIWYTPISGVWQTVWLESLPQGYLKTIRLSPNLEEGSVTFDLESDTKEVGLEISHLGNVIVKQTIQNKEKVFLPKDAIFPWSPETPNLYDVTLTAGEDRVTSYFALRTFEAKEGKFYLNHRPYFVNGVLDQGYFSDGIYTPPSYQSFADDILAMKELGFNTLRKHIKIEPMQFYYLCDKLGMLVFQDMMNVGKYSFFKDTVIPFAGFRKHLPYRTVNQAQRENFIAHAKQTVDYLYQTPSVVYYTIFNEGWGQFDGDGLYHLLKAQDPTRVYDATSGWFWESKSDVDSEHIYFKPIPPKETKRPRIISEFGGYSCNCEGHRFNTEKTFGYRTYDSCEETQEAFLRLYEEEILPAIDKGLAGVIYTQLSDVEDETNGIYTYDRQICKFSKEKVKPLMERVFQAGSK